jgi:hypothetical protein
MAEHYARTRTRGTVLLDEVRESPVDRELLRGRRWRFGIAVVLVVAALAAGLLPWGSASSGDNSRGPVTSRP